MTRNEDEMEREGRSGTHMKGEGEENPRRQVRRLVGSVAQAPQQILVGKEGEKTQAMARKSEEERKGRLNSIASQSETQYIYNPVNSNLRVAVRNHRI
jgi:hypothetical protein